MVELFVAVWIRLLRERARLCAFLANESVPIPVRSSGRGTDTRSSEMTFLNIGGGGMLRSLRRAAGFVFREEVVARNFKSTEECEDQAVER